MKQVELMAPAGNFESLRAAINAGADAVYLGFEGFNARSMAKNFTPRELDEAIIAARVLGRRAYLTVNILVTDPEIEQVTGLIKNLITLPDGFIVQDLGLAGILKREFPGVPLHASTQMTTLTLEGVQVLEKLGFSRAIPGRELSLKETERIARGSKLGLEIFVHGALCYGVSGQCLFSSMAGGRSGNRGVCAQPCRMLYRILETGNDSDPGPGAWSHALTARGLCRIEMIPKLIEAGVSAFKIEGRSRSPEYVGTVVDVYRRVIDGYYDDPENFRMPKTDMDLLHGAFDRDLTLGIDDRSGALQGRRRKTPGPLLGRIEAVKPYGFAVKLKLPLRKTDAIEIWTQGGGNVRFQPDSIETRGREVEKAGADEIAVIKTHVKASIHDRIFLITNQTDAGFSYKKFADSRIISFKLTARDGAHIRLTARAGNKTVELESEFAAQKARGKSTSPESIREKIAGVDLIPVVVESVEMDIEEGLYIPFGAIARLRDRALAALWEPSLKEPKPGPKALTEEMQPLRKTNSRQWIVELDSDCEPFRDMKCASEIIIPLDGKSKEFGVFLQKADKIRSLSSQVRIKLPHPIFQNYAPEVQDQVQKLIKLGYKNFSLTNLSQVKWFENHSDLDLVAEHQMNVFNLATIQVLRRLGFSRAVLSPELNRGQIQAIGEPSVIEPELIVYGRLPVLYSRWGLGPSAPEKGLIEDKKGFKFPYEFRMETVTLFNSRIMDLSNYISELEKAGILHFRIILGHDEDPGVVINRFLDDEAGQTGDGRKRMNDMFTRGHYHRGVTF